MFSIRRTRSAHCRTQERMINHGLIVAIFGILACVKGDLCDPGKVIDSTGEYCVPVQECRQKGYVIYENVCFFVCPNGVRYFDNETRTCYNECPPYMITQGSYCQNASYCSQKHEVLYNGTCFASCPDEAPFLESGVCGTSCSMDMLSNGTDCIPESRCLDDGWVKLDGTCRVNCSSEVPFNHSGSCVTKCPHTFLIKGFTCLDSETCLAASQFVHRGSCVERCPETAPYSGSGICYSSCPSTLLIHENRTECVTQNQCLERGMFIWNLTCRLSCPKGSPFSSNGHCVTVCPQTHVSLEGVCILSSDCYDFDKHNRVIFRRKCIESCPLTTLFMEKGHCKTMCSDGRVANNHVCISINDCLYHHRVIHGGNCLSQCPIEAPYLNPFQTGFSCKKECPYGTLKMDNTSYLNSLQCKRSTCKKNVKGVNCTSRDACPFFVQGDTCLNKCPDASPYAYDHKCYTVCPQSTVLDTSNCNTRCRTCILQCPSNLPFSYLNSCHEHCPEQTVHAPNETECFAERQCENQNHFMFNSTCDKDCPTSVPYKHKHRCHERCPEETLHMANKTECFGGNMCLFEGYVMYDGICLENCPEAAPYKYNYRCHERCPKQTLHRAKKTECFIEDKCYNEGSVMYNDICLEDCPESVPYKYIHKCHERCPGNTLHRINETECFVEVICYHEGFVKFNDTCLEDCPEAAPYKSNHICHERCPNKPLHRINEYECLDICDHMVYKDLCLDNCPEQAPYSHSQMCLSSCPVGTVYYINETTCYSESQCVHPDGQHCPNASGCAKTRVIYNRTCLDACPPVTRFIIEGKCIADCSEGTLMCAKHRSWILISETVCLLPCLVLLNRLLKPRDRESHGRSTNIVWVKRNKQRGEEDQGRLSEEVEMDDTDMTVV